MAEVTIGKRRERATEAVLIKFTPSERARINAAATEAGLGFGPFVKRWMASVCASLERAAKTTSEE